MTVNNRWVFLSCNKHFSLADVDFHYMLQRVTCIVTTSVNCLEFWERTGGSTSCWWTWCTKTGGEGQPWTHHSVRWWSPLPSQNVQIYCNMRLAYQQECCLYTCALHYQTKNRFHPNFFVGKKEANQIKFPSIIKNVCI